MPAPRIPAGGESQPPDVALVHRDQLGLGESGHGVVKGKTPNSRRKWVWLLPGLDVPMGSEPCRAGEPIAPSPVWLLDAEEAKRQLQTLGRQNALMESPAQGHRESRQEEGAVGLTPEQHPGLWNQLHLGAHASF